MALPEGLELLDDVPATAAGVRPKAGLAGNPYNLQMGTPNPLRAASQPTPAAPIRDVHRRGGLTLPVPALVVGAVGVALLSALLAWAAVGMSRGRSPVEKRALVPDVAAAVGSGAASEPTPKPATPQVAAAPAPGLADRTESDSQGRATIITQPAIEAEESDFAAKARAGASTVATRDDGAGKTLSTADIVAESEPSVALIKGKSSSGTGFLVAPGLLATNAHVIEDEFISDLEVRFVSADEKHNAPLKAELLYEDRDRDLAFLAVKTDLKPLRVAKTYTFRKGEDITVIGNPGIGDGQVLENAISRGVMSTKTKIENRNFYQLGIAINPGNSGGPVFDSSGRVIGVATLKSSKQEATGFSIPIEDFQEALAKLAKQPSLAADKVRSQHRLKTAVKGLGSGGAIMCLVIDLRRAAANSNSTEIKDLLARLEPIATEMGKEVFPSLLAQPARIAKDMHVGAAVKGQIGEMAENFTKIRVMFAGRMAFDNNQLRQWQQLHK